MGEGVITINGCAISNLRFAWFVSLIVLLACLAGCGSPPSPTSLPDANGGFEAKEAPVLSASVRAGRLPALEKRLPQKPLVVPAYEQPGYYGGTWKMMVDNPDLGMYKMIAGYAPMMRWKTFSCA